MLSLALPTSKLAKPHFFSLYLNEGGDFLRHSVGNPFSNPGAEDEKQVSVGVKDRYKEYSAKITVVIDKTIVDALGLGNASEMGSTRSLFSEEEMKLESDSKAIGVYAVIEFAMSFESLQEISKCKFADLGGVDFHREKSSFRLSLFQDSCPPSCGNWSGTTSCAFESENLDR